MKGSISINGGKWIDCDLQVENYYNEVKTSIPNSFTFYIEGDSGDLTRMSIILWRLILIGFAKPPYKLKY